MRMYFYPRVSIYDTEQEVIAEKVISETFRCKVVSHHDHLHDRESHLFDILCDCDALMIEAYRNSKYDKKMKWVLKVMTSLNKPIYFYTQSNQPQRRLK